MFESLVCFAVSFIIYFRPMPPTEYYVHPNSILDDGCVIGKGTKIWHFSHIMAGCIIGVNRNLGKMLWCLPKWY